MPPYSALRLRAHPFAPEKLVGGQTVRFDYQKGPLDPKASPVDLEYYFDLYAWDDSKQLGPLAPNGRINEFPSRGGVYGSIIVISGVSGTGRTSLEELLLFEIASRSKSPPIVTLYPIAVTSKQVQDASNFANRFISRVEAFLVTSSDRRKEIKALPKTLKGIVKEWKEGLVGDDPNTEFLFTALAENVRGLLPDTPIVFRLDATSHLNTPDTWTPACTMLRNLADYVILSLSDQDHARYLRTSLLDRQVRIFWVDVPRVDEAKTRRFLEHRLGAEREGAADELFPFTAEALKALFAPTEGNKPRSLPISVALKNLRGVFDRKCTDLEALLKNAAGAGALPEARLRITADDMKGYFSR